MSSSVEQSRSWSELPPELLASISTSLLTISDYVRFRSVCSSWRASASPSPRHLPLQLPILLANHHHHPLFSILSPSFSRHQILGSSSGYLALRSPSSSSLSLLNPVTLSQIHLPFLNTFPMSPFFIKKVVLSPPPPDSISVLALLGWSTSLALSLPGRRSSWTLLPGCANYHDALFFRGRFHVVDGFRRVFVLDADAGRLSEAARVEVARAPPFLGRADKCYLVESAGDLLLVIRKFNGSVSATVGFEVFRLGLGKETAEVEVVKSLGDRMLFLGLNCSVSFLETDVGRRPAAAAAGFRGDCIYFLDDTLNSVGDLARGGWDVAVYSMGDGTIRPFPLLSMVGDGGSQICGRRPPAVWFTPGLC
ncbi:putative basic proline-rich protein-like [Iris pallida]|uniref:Basic proline-rich protein-like n=1 Tax=Iris pallida TaxID=29817 RepID=A0AAX6HGG7_IRIPA|nr:putative basic proline-rich protein-like [Iris pallida]